MGNIYRTKKLVTPEWTFEQDMFYQHLEKKIGMDYMWEHYSKIYTHTNLPALPKEKWIQQE